MKIEKNHFYYECSVKKSQEQNKVYQDAIEKLVENFEIGFSGMSRVNIHNDFIIDNPSNFDVFPKDSASQIISIKPLNEKGRINLADLLKGAVVASVEGNKYNIYLSKPDAYFDVKK